MSFKYEISLLLNTLPPIVPITFCIITNKWYIYFDTHPVQLKENTRRCCIITILSLLCATTEWFCTNCTSFIFIQLSIKVAVNKMLFSLISEICWKEYFVTMQIFIIITIVLCSRCSYRVNQKFRNSEIFPQGGTLQLNNVFKSCLLYPDHNWVR